MSPALMIFSVPGDQIHAAVSESPSTEQTDKMKLEKNEKNELEDPSSAQMSAKCSYFV